MGKYRRLPPWQEITYFETPIWTVIEITNTGAWTQILGANPQRVALMFSSSSGGQVTTDPSISVSAGLFVPDTSQPIHITERETGSLVSQAWFGTSQTTGTRITAVEVVLRQWPDD